MFVVVLGVAGLGVTEPVLCAMAMPTDNANTDIASKILRIKSCSLLYLRVRGFRPQNVSRSNPSLKYWDAVRVRADVAGKVAAALFAFSASIGSAFLPALSHNLAAMDKDRGLLLFFRLYLQ